MTTTILTAAPTDAAPARDVRRTDPIPLRRLLAVELRKMFDTRAGFWLMASVAVVSVLASVAVIAWAPRDELNLGTFSGAIGMPLAVVLPVIAILSVTSEYSQRSGLTTYALVPRRGRVVLAKLLVTAGVGVLAMVVALGVGAVGNVVGGAIVGSDPVWDIGVAEFVRIVLGNVLGMMVGFTLGVLLRSSPAAIVGYFVYAMVLPGALGALAAFQEWFRDLQPWVDVNYTITWLFDQPMTAENWLQLAVTTVVWLWLPMALGLRAVLRAEVK